MGKAISVLTGDQIKSRGVLLDTHSKLISPAAKAEIFWGIYESAEFRFVRDYLDPNLDVVELGASIGFISSIIGKRLLPERKLVCVEANSLLMATLADNVKRNIPRVNCCLVNAAVDYSVPPGANTVLEFGVSHLMSKVAGRNTHGVTVCATRLEAILATHQIEEYQLVSDIEGAEAGLIEFDLGALAKCRQLIIELHDTKLDSRSITVDEMCQTLQSKHSFVLVDRYGPVFVFRHSTPACAPTTPA